MANRFDANDSNSNEKFKFKREKNTQRKREENPQKYIFISKSMPLFQFSLFAIKWTFHNFILRLNESINGLMGIEFMYRSLRVFMSILAVYLMKRKSQNCPPLFGLHKNTHKQIYCIHMQRSCSRYVTIASKRSANLLTIWQLN